MRECSKSIQRRLADSNFLRRYFTGDGLDVGGRPDPLALYTELFPLLRSVRTWDRGDGDAQDLVGVIDGSYDFVHSSHCLEHLSDPRLGLRSWFRALRPGGYLVVTVPDEDMYEQGMFPSTFNRDHKWTFTMYKTRSWSSRSLNLMELLTDIGESAEVIKIEQLSATYRFALPRYDQTITPIGECGIEFVVRKRPADEVAYGGRRPRFDVRVDRGMRVLLNQYVADMATLKERNLQSPPFGDDGDISTELTPAPSFRRPTGAGGEK